jgi:hypothetical protein
MEVLAQRIVEKVCVLGKWLGWDRQDMHTECSWHELLEGRKKWNCNITL